MNAHETPGSSDPLPVFGPATPRAPHPVRAVLLAFLPAVLFPLYGFLVLAPGGIRMDIDAAGAARKAAPLILAVPITYMVIFGGAYAAERIRRRHNPSTSGRMLVISISVVLFWVGLLAWQSHRDAVFQRNLEARLQPWAEGLLARPSSDIVAADGKTVRAELVQAFIGPARGVVVHSNPDLSPQASETCIGVYYGASFFSPHGYYAGQKTLRVQEGRHGVRKVSDGLFRFQYE